jgi:hypothetical protein
VINVLHTISVSPDRKICTLTCANIDTTISSLGKIFIILPVVILKNGGREM